MKQQSSKKLRCVSLDMADTSMPLDRNERFDSRLFFARGKPITRQNQYGGSLGGPISRYIRSLGSVGSCEFLASIADN